MGKETLIYRSNPSFTGQFLRDINHKVSRKITRQSQLPWMKQKELDLILEILTNKNPKKCLEWGAGFSTVLFPELLEADASWTSIEHNREWKEILAKKDLKNNVELNLVEPDRTPYGEVDKDGSYDDFKTYILKPSGHYDFIFIDGRSRKNCVKRAYDELLAPEGIIILHDANRKHYHEPLKNFKHQIMFDDHHNKYGGVWIGSKDQPIDNILDIEKHKKLWKKHLTFNSIINFNWL